MTAAQMFDLADKLVARGGIAEAEVVLEALTRSPDLDTRCEARFRIGLLREHRGDWAGAAQAYRAVLEENPSAGPVRLQLAGVLARMGDNEGAGGQLRRAKSEGLPNAVARLVDQFEASLRPRQRIGARFELGLAPDSNINRAQGRSSIDINSVPFELSRDARARSGTGAMVGGQAFWRPPLGPRSNFLMTIDANVDLYRQSQLDVIDVAFAAGPEFLSPNGRRQFSGVIKRRWFGQQPYSNGVGVKFGAWQSVGSKGQTQFELSAIRDENLLDPSRTGTSVDATMRYERALSPTLSGRVGVMADRSGARDPAFAYWSIGGDVLLAREGRSLTLFGRAGAYRTRADAAFSFPPVRRDDLLVDAEAGAVLHHLTVFGLSPVVRIHRTQNRSPVFFYDFDRTQAELGFMRAF